MKNFKKKGISLIEILVIISIIGIISAIVFPSFSSFHKKQELQNTTEDIVSLLNEARNNTISSKNSNIYGVHFEINKAVLFTGSSYTEDDASNKVVMFDSAVRIANVGGVVLNGGGNNIIFARLSGETTNYGTIILYTYVADNTPLIKTIDINKVGLVHVN